MPRDYAEAVRWYRSGAEQGFAAAQTNLGEMYVMGLGVMQDYAEAVRWYRAAAEQGELFAQVNLGGMYGNGRGVPQDYVTAHMWLNIAARSGIRSFVDAREIVASSMTPTDISEAQRRARVCLESGYRTCD